MASIGIDFGIKNCCAGFFKDGHVEIIANGLGDRITPAAVTVNHGNLLPGELNKKTPSNNAIEIRRFIGLKLDDAFVQENANKYPFAFVEEDGDLAISFGGTQCKARELVVLLLKHIKQYAELYLDQTADRAVITIPIDFTQHEALIQAGNSAGFDEVRLLYEPIAAAVANGDIPDRTVLVYDFGGGRFQVTILKLINGRYVILGRDGDDDISGGIIDEKIALFLKDNVMEEHDVDIGRNLAKWLRFLMEAEWRKIELSNGASSNVSFAYLDPDLDDIEINAAQFNIINKDIFKKTVQIVDRCIGSAGLEKTLIDDVLLIGGSCKIPRVRELLQEYFDRELEIDGDSEHIIAKGAAIVASTWDESYFNVDKDFKIASAPLQSQTVKNRHRRPKSGISQIFKKVLNFIKCSSFMSPSIHGVRKISKAPLSSSSGNYLEEMYASWLKDPSSVHVSWDAYFRNMQNHAGPMSVAHTGPSASVSTDDISLHQVIQAVIRNYQVHGHSIAKLDPLGIMYTDPNTTISDHLGGIPQQVLRIYKLDKKHMDRKFILPPFTHIGGSEKELTLKETIRRLEMVYCRHIGVEYTYMDNLEHITWLREKLETPGAGKCTNPQKKLILERLCRTSGLESFLATKWPSEKRFGIEGGDVLIPAMKLIIDRSSEYGVDTFNIGIPHRGRLNLLANVCRKPLKTIFTQFKGLKADDNGSGDVKYHLGTTVNRLNRQTNKNVKLSVVANASHLESVDPIVQGKTRAEQFFRGDVEGKHVMSIQVHGDAAFSGQGIVFETIHLSHLPEYTTHGTIHIVSNNQIGFTTDPRFSRSSMYCTDVAKALSVPIFHVNSDCPESVMHVCNLAVEFRAKFHRDVVIDIVGYRRNGHNEIDEPMFTQPLMYKKIKQMKPIFNAYAEKLVGQKVVTQEEVDNMVGEYKKICQDEFDAAAKETRLNSSDWLDSPWTGFFSGKDPLKCAPTGVKEEVLKHIGTVFSSPPPEELAFVVHRGIDRILRQRREMVAARMADWALGEALCYGSLLKEGVHVRLSGQDVERGTFSHRHHILHHQTVDKLTYKPLGHLYPDQAKYTVSNSALSEGGVMGFELGYSMVNPNQLVMWEGQFGDFCNTGTCIIDQYISSGQTKWVRQSGLVLQLPHGMEGMGPEHSSARVERFLQMCYDDPDTLPPSDNMAMKQLHECNWIVANCSTPGNLFHILRRQVALPFRKPLVLLTPKNLLRHPDCKSSFDEMIEGTEFRRVIPDNEEASKNPDAVKKLLLCSGKVYYNIRTERNKKNLQKDIAMSRIEQFSPFPYDLVKIEVEKYKNAKVYWLQEEHKNQGPWSYIQPRFYTCTGGKRDFGYIGRKASPSTATGHAHQHNEELAKLINDALIL